ncbi:prepilin peptidase [Candidatus Woesearchaeota archaeon]|nr:prepilin peptidase [Candidatus Woesearchaeota archaeon]
MIEWLVLGFVLVVGSITDLRSREVSDWLCYAGIASGVGIALVSSVYAFSFISLLKSLLGLLVFGVIGWLFYFSNQWASGDAFVLAGVGAFFGFELSVDSLWLGFVFDLFVVASFYSVFWLVWLAFSNWSRFIVQFPKSVAFFSWTKGSLFVLIFILMFSLFFPSWYGLVLAVLVFLLFYLLPFAHAVQQCCFIKRISPSGLTLGDWLGESIKVGGKVIVSKEKRGLGAQDIELIMRLHSQGRLSTVMLKTGIPFVPAFLLAFLLVLWKGNVLLFFLA